MPRVSDGECKTTERPRVVADMGSPPRTVAELTTCRLVRLLGFCGPPGTLFISIWLRLYGGEAEKVVGKGGTRIHGPCMGARWVLVSDDRGLPSCNMPPGQVVDA